MSLTRPAGQVPSGLAPSRQSWYDLAEVDEELLAMMDGRLLHRTRLYAVPPDGGRVTVSYLPGREPAA